MRPVIFAVSAVLLVPFVYASTSLSDVCAVPQDPGYARSTSCVYEDDSKKRMICCWSEPDINNPGEYITWCQSCDTASSANCGPIELKKQTTGPMGIPPGGLQDGGVLQDPSSVFDPKLSGKQGIFQGQNMTFSQANITSSNDTSTTRTGIEYNPEGQERSYEDKTEDKESGTTKEDDSEQPDDN